MQIKVVNTKGELLGNAQVWLSETGEKGEVQNSPLERGNALFLYPERPSDQAYLVAECDGYEPIRTPLSFYRRYDERPAELRMGKTGSRYFVMGGTPMVIEDPKDEFEIPTDIAETLRNRIEMDWQELSRFSSMAKVDEGSGEANNSVRFGIPTERGKQKQLAMELEKLGVPVLSVVANDDFGAPVLLSQKVVIACDLDLSEENLNSLLLEFDLKREHENERTLDGHKLIYATFQGFPNYEMLAEMERLGQVEGIFSALSQLIFSAQPSYTPPDFLFGARWSLPVANVPSAWELLFGKSVSEGYGSADVIVQAFDSGVESNMVGGIRSTSPDMNTNVQGGALTAFLGGFPGIYPTPSHKVYLLHDLSSGGGSINPIIFDNDGVTMGHGTNVAGIFAASGGVDLDFPGNGVAGNQGIVGVSPNVRLMSTLWDFFIPFPQTAMEFRYLAGLSPGWNAGSFVGGGMGPVLNSRNNPGPGFSISNHSHTMPGASIDANIGAGGSLALAIDGIVSFGRNRRGAFMLFAAGNAGRNIQNDMRIGLHEKVIVVAGSSLNSLGFEERTSYSNYGSTLAAFNGAAEYGEVDFCAPTNHHVAFDGVSNDGAHWFQNPPVNYGILTTDWINNSPQLGNTPNTATNVTTLSLPGPYPAGTNQITVNNIAGFAAGNSIWLQQVGGPSEFAHIALMPGGNVVTLRDVLKNTYNAGDTVSVGPATHTDGFSGTSAACPFASGVMALVISANPKLSFWEARDIVKSTAEKIDLRMFVPMGVPNLNVRWTDANGAGNNVVGNDGLLVTNTMPTLPNYLGSIVSAVNLNNPGRSLIQLNSVANLQVGRALLIGAESAATNFPTNNSVTVNSALDFQIGDQIQIYDGPISFLAIPSPTPFGGPLALANNRILMGNAIGFEVGHFLQIGATGNPNTEFGQITGISYVNAGGFGGDLIVTLAAPLANPHPINTPIQLANSFQRNITGKAGNTITFDGPAINPANYPIGVGLPSVIIRKVGTELAIIREINIADSTVVTNQLVNAQVAGTPVRGGFIPHYSPALGSGRVDAYYAVKAALNYDFSQRDLMIRNSMADDGVDATDGIIDSPDIWGVNGGALPNNLVGAHGQPNTPANYQTSGDGIHQKPLRSGACNFYLRIGNRGAQNSFDYSAHIRLGLKDEDLDEPILVSDYINGPTTAYPFTYLPTRSTVNADVLFIGQVYNLNSGHPGTKTLADVNSVRTNPVFAGAPGAILPAVPSQNGIHYAANLAQADRPRLPYGYTVVRTTSANIAADTVLNLEHTRGLSNGQQILVGRPSDPGYELATINADPTISTVTLAAGLANAQPQGTLIIRLENVNTQLNGAHAAGGAGAKYSTLTVDSAAGFKLGNYVVTGNLPDAANNKFHRIVRIIRDTATNTEKLIVEPKLPAALADNTLITQVGGRLGTFVLGEVTPHDGILDGNTPADNNNISYKRVNFEHDVLFRETDGTTTLRDQIQVASDGTTLTTPFRVYVQDLDQFNTEKVVLTLTRQLLNGDLQSETYYYKTSAPAGWILTPNTAGWLTMNAPLISTSGLAATGNQTDIYFAGTLDADNTVQSLSVTVNVEGNDPHPLGAQDFITTRTHTAQIFQVANLPDPNDPGLQDATGMPALVGTQTMHVFADMADLEQSQVQAFGPVDTTKFRLTSSFDTTSNPLAVVNAYAAVDGIVFLQRNLTDNTINLVLKPIKQAEIGFNKVKYFIYRGLREDDIINMGAPLEMKVNGTAYPDANFVDYVNQTNDALNPGVPVPMTALGWDPTNQALEDLVDDFFFNSSAVRQLPVVKRGMVLARFNNPLIGFEIVLAEGSYPLTLANIRQASYTLDVSGIANLDDRAAKREEILNYIDPAAYYGMHYLSGLLRAVIPDPDPATIDTEKRTKTDLYNDFVSKFWTKNTLYLDIRNDNGYSYNYYGNYTQQTGSDLGKAIKLGYIPPAQQALTTSKFETQEWPIIIYNNETMPENNPENMSAVYFQLSTADNGDPIAFFEYGNAVSSTTDNNYATSADLLETLTVTNIDGGTNTIRVAGNTSALAVGSLFYLIDCDHGPANSQYRIAAMAPNGGDTDLTVEAGTFDYNAGSGPALGLVHFQNWSKVVVVSHPNEPTIADPNKKVNVASMVKLRYFRQMHESGKPVTAIDQANKRITVAGLVARQLKEGDKLIWSDATGTTNNGTYTIAANGVLQIGNDTRVEVLEAIPDAFAGGGVDGKVKVKPTKVPAIGHYTEHKFGSLNSMMRRFKITNLVVNSAVQSTITIAGDYRHILDRNTHLSIVDASTPGNNGNYAIASPSALDMAGDTEVVVTTVSALSAAILPDPDKDLISVVALPWRSDQPTQWIAGLDLRYLDVRKQLTDAAGTVKAGFAYMGQTGVAVEQDRMIFHMTPLNFFSVPQNAYTPKVVNMNGGTSTEESFWAVMQQQNQALILNATMLRIMPGPVILPVFDFVDDATDAIADDIEKSNFLSLCITRAEFERLKEAADAQLNGLHDLTLVLRRQQDLTDANGVAYKSFELAVSGYTRKTDGSLVAHEAFPVSAVQVFSLREDAVVFTSKDFADVENTEVKRTNFEEGLRMGTDALNVYALNPTLQAHINTFNADLIALDHDFPAIEALVQSRAETLWNLALASADAGGSNPYDDRQLYWARLHGRNAIREHATLKLQFGRRKQLMQLWDDWSRGYHSVDFSGAPVGAKKILVTGFDPFFMDPNDPDDNTRQSNPAGSIALYLNGKTLVNGGTQAFIQTMVFPVRYADFDAGKIEEMISPYVSGANKVDAIFTCSQDIINYFNVDRFAARARTKTTKDNENRIGISPKYRQYRASDGKFVKTGARNLPNFLQTTLPGALMDDTLGNTRPIGSNLQIVVPNQVWLGELSGSTVSNGFVWDPDLGAYNPTNVEVAPAANVVPKSGSGGSYLSNEIFYRVALMRTTLPAAVSFTGHLHVPMLQQNSGDDFSVTNTTTLVQNARTIIIDAIPGL